MTAVEFWDEPLSPEKLPYTGQPLDDDQMTQLWSMFGGIASHWDLKIEVELLRSRWLEMLKARSSGGPARDYRGEYDNAARVFKALEDKHDTDFALTMIYAKTKVMKPEEANTRLTHAKLYVANDFIRCFIAAGGFRGFVPDARNYTGFMGGSRFREWDPVRTGKRK